MSEMTLGNWPRVLVTLVFVGGSSDRRAFDTLPGSILSFPGPSKFLTSFHVVVSRCLVRLPLNVSLPFCVLQYIAPIWRLCRVLYTPSRVPACYDWEGVPKRMTSPSDIFKTQAVEVTSPVVFWGALYLEKGCKCETHCTTRSRFDPGGILWGREGHLGSSISGGPLADKAAVCLSGRLPSLPCHGVPARGRPIRSARPQWRMSPRRRRPVLPVRTGAGTACTPLSWLRPQVGAIGLDSPYNTRQHWRWFSTTSFVRWFCGGCIWQYLSYCGEPTIN